MSNQGNNSARVVNPGVDQVIVSSAALFDGQYSIDFETSSSDGSGETAFQLLRNANNVILVSFQEMGGGLVPWIFTGPVKAGDIFQVVSKTATARIVHGSITWLQRSE